MKPLSAAELLYTWERGFNYTPIERALLVLTAAISDDDPGNPALLSIGDRDARLIKLREWMFGTQLFSITNCPQCSQLIEWQTDITDLHFHSSAITPALVHSLHSDSYSIQFRLPNSEDILETFKLAENVPKAKRLLTNCIIEAKKDGSVIPSSDLPEELLNILGSRMEAEDLRSNVQMDLNCPECSFRWQSPFDIATYLWMEIDNWARHILNDIAVLASTFGWSESQVLALSPRRRQLYIDMTRK